MHPEEDAPHFVLISHLHTSTAHPSIAISCKWSPFPSPTKQGPVLSPFTLTSQYSTQDLLHLLHLSLCRICFTMPPYSGKAQVLCKKSKLRYLFYARFKAICQLVSLVLCRCLSYRPNENFLTENFIAITLKWSHSPTDIYTTVSKQLLESLKSPKIKDAMKHVAKTETLYLHCINDALRKPQRT